MNQNSEYVNLPPTSNGPVPAIHSTDLFDCYNGVTSEKYGHCDSVLKHINQVLMEDDMEDEACMVEDSTLHAAEEYYYKILNERHPSSPNPGMPCEEKPSRSSSCGGSSADANNPVESAVVGPPCMHCTYVDHAFQTNSPSSSSRSFSSHSVADLVFFAYTSDGDLPTEASGKWQQYERAKGYYDKITYTKKGVSKRKAVEMRKLLIQCMQSVAGGNDQMTATKLLKQIRLRSSPQGDESERLAHYFANGLEARLINSKIPEYRPFYMKGIVESDVWEALNLYVSAFPFAGISYFVATQMLMELAKKASSLHIIHFGITYGSQGLYLFSVYLKDLVVLPSFASRQ
ncbi:scarecrow-like protein 14 [Diospyros lotus]|uniref:scarecrow-like protein 14 n=1 Tax=Diospyros lotus TaxID=55363 RepID=UPI00225510DB|nr:scarecrow-like protein 14 [Diospyros lotus]